MNPKLRIIQMVEQTEAKSFHANQWGKRHVAAWTVPKAGAELAIKTMIEGLAEYAAAHEKQYGVVLGQDYVLGDYWLTIAKATIGLLNGEAGRFDCGTLDGLIRDIAADVGFDRDLEDRSDA